MERIGHIVCCVDTGAPATAALARVRRLWPPPVQVSAVHVAPPETVMRGGLTEWEIDEHDPLGPPRRWLTALAERHEAAAVLLTGEPAPTLRAWLDGLERPPDLVVGAAHNGRVARIALGSIARELAHHAPVDTLIVPPGNHDSTQDSDPPGPVLIAVDTEHEAAAVIDAVQRLTSGIEPAPAIEIVHVASPPVPVGRDLVAGTAPMPDRRRTEAEGLLERVGRLAPAAERTLLSGDPVGQLTELARHRGARLLALGPRSGRRDGVGTVASRLIRAAPCPVLLARNL